MAADILVVDDEADIRELVAGILDDEGHCDAHRRRQRQRARRDRRAPARPDLPRHLAAGQPPRRAGAARRDQRASIPTCRWSSSPATATSRPRSPPSSAAPTTTSRSRSRPTACVLVAERALEAHKLRREIAELRQRSGESEELRRRVRRDEQPAPDDRAGRADQQPRHDLRPVRRRQGAGGARASTTARTRAGGPFVVLNAAAITPERMEIELFGDGGAERRRAARSARSRKPMAARSISTRSPTCRARRRTRSCACSSTRRSSGSAAPTEVKVDVRVLSSTARDLEQEIAEGRFREDLFHRLNVVPLRVPALAERREDIPDLVDAFHRPDLARRPACRAAASATTRWRSCRRTTGRATSASSATTSSGC